MADYFKSIITRLLVTGLVLANLYADVGDQDAGRIRGSRTLNQHRASRVKNELMCLEVETAIRYGDKGYIEKFGEDNKDTNPAELGLEERSWDEVLQRLINESKSGDSYSEDSYLARIEAKRLFVQGAFDRGDIDFMTELSKGGKDPRHFGLKGDWDQVIQKMQKRLSAESHQ